MIKSIRAKNFQTHEDTILNLHPGVNVITGIGDSGKTAILRLIKWVQTNRPLSHRFRSDFADGDTLGEITFDDGSVAHTKNKDGSVYTVSGHPKPFRKVKTSVPDVVADLFHMTEINFQGQYDKPFLLTMTKGKLAQMFNRVAELDDIGIWLDDLKSRHTEQHFNEAKSTKLYESAEETIARYKHFGKFEALVTEAKVHEKNRECSETDADAAYLVYGRIRNRLDRLEQLEGLDRIATLIEDATKQDALAVNINEIIYKLSTMESKRAKLTKFDKAIEDMEQLKAAAMYLEQDRCATAAMADDLSALETKRRELSQRKAEIKKLQHTYRRALEKLGKCPICFTDIDQEVINREVTKYD